MVIDKLQVYEKRVHALRKVLADDWESALPKITDSVDSKICLDIPEHDALRAKKQEHQTLYTQKK